MQPSASLHPDFVHGRFLAPEGELLRSVDPTDGSVVFETAASPARVTAACEAAADALPAWRALSIVARLEALHRFREALRERAEPIADAIVLETGKIRSEARAEVATLIARFDLALDHVRTQAAEGALRGHPNAELRHHPLGVVGVIGPFNFPLHLCHAHVLPALLPGNAVVVKPSDVTPLSARRYAEAIDAAALPPGVLNVVQGGGASGAALVADPRLRGLCFTGSWPTGKRILEATLDRPEILVALEMGGKNVAVVLKEADVRQAAHEVVTGGYLTAGQRCTCTDRVLVHEALRAPLLEALSALVSGLHFGHPDDPASFAGPLTTAAGRDRLARALEAAVHAGASRIASGTAAGAVSSSPRRCTGCPTARTTSPATPTRRCSGPTCRSRSSSPTTRPSRSSARPYGLANAVFTGTANASSASTARPPRASSTATAPPTWRARGCRSAAWARAATTGRPGLRPAQRQPSGRGSGARARRGGAAPAARLAPRGSRPGAPRRATRGGGGREGARDLVAHPRPLSKRLPEGGRLPESERWLARLYAGDRVVREKKPGVFDHLRSAGPWFDRWTMRRCPSSTA